MVEERSRNARVRATVAFYQTLVLAALLWFLGKFVRYAFPPLFETMQASYTVSTTAIGLAFSGFMVLYALMQFPSGALADRFGATRVITVGALIAGAGSLWVLLEPPFLVLVLAMAVIGAGTGAHKTVSVQLLSVVYPSRFGRTLGVFDTIGASGGVLAPLAVAAILGLALVRWPVLFGVTALGFIGVAIAFWSHMRRDHHRPRSVDTSGSILPWRSYLHTFRRRRLLGFMGVTVLTAFAYNGLVAFLPLALTVEGRLEPTTASLLYGVLFVASVAQLVTGEAADRIGPLPTATGSLVLANLGLVGLVGLFVFGLDLTTPLGLGLTGAVILAIGLGAHGYRPARDVYIVSLVPSATTGGSLGVIRTTLMISGAISPAVVGVLADVWSFAVAFAALTVVAGLSVAMILLVGSWERAAGSRRASTGS